MNWKRLILFAGLFGSAGPNAALAGSISMICENPRREYRVEFDESSKTFLADSTTYTALAVETTKDRYLVVGLTVADGPTFRAHFRPYKKMEFFQNSELVQTDGCR